MQRPRRLIYGELFHSERVCSLKIPVRYSYIGLLIRAADDMGNFEWQPKVLHGDILAHDLGHISLRDFEGHLESIKRAGLVKLYMGNGKSHGGLWNWRQDLREYRPVHPKPPPDFLEWQFPGDFNPWLKKIRNAAPKEPEPNRIRTEGELKPEPLLVKACLHVSPVLMARYAEEHCALRLEVEGARRLLSGVKAENDWAAIRALEHVASRDPRTRWNDAGNPLRILISIAQAFRDGIGPADGPTDYEPFLNWCARNGINPKGGPAGNRQSAIGEAR